MAMTDDQNASIRAFAATNPTDAELAEAKKTYGVSDADYTNAITPTASTNYSASSVAAPSVMTDAQNASIKAFAATNPSAAAKSAAQIQYGVSDAQYAAATNPYAAWNAYHGTTYDASGNATGPAAAPVAGLGGQYANVNTGGSTATGTATPVLQSSGIISSVSAPSTYSAAKTTADTVESRMARLTDPNSAYNQSVAAGARGSANQRGLLNSSIGESMVQDGIIKNALSIATPDAAATNTANQFNANANNQAGQFNASAQNAINLLSQANAYDSTKTATNQTNTVANADATIAANRLTTASSAVASIMNNTLAYIASIDRTLSGEAQQALKDGFNTQAKVSLQIIGSLAGDVDLSKYIDSLFPA